MAVSFSSIVGGAGQAKSGCRKALYTPDCTLLSCQAPHDPSKYSIYSQFMEGFIVYGFACCRAPPYALFSPPPACLSYIRMVTGSWFLSYPAGYLGIYVLTPNSQVYGWTMPMHIPYIRDGTLYLPVKGGNDIKVPQNCLWQEPRIGSNFKTIDAGPCQIAVVRGMIIAGKPWVPADLGGFIPVR